MQYAGINMLAMRKSWLDLVKKIKLVQTMGLFQPINLLGCMIREVRNLPYHTDGTVTWWCYGGTNVGKGEHVSPSLLFFLNHTSHLIQPLLPDTASECPPTNPTTLSST